MHLAMTSKAVEENRYEQKAPWDEGSSACPQCSVHLSLSYTDTWTET